MVKIKSKIYIVIPLILLVVVFAPLFSSCKNLNGPSTIENVHWESVDGPELSFNYINYDDSFGTLTYNNETMEIHFIWNDSAIAFIVVSQDYQTDNTSEETNYSVYFTGIYEDFDRDNLTITLIIQFDYIFNNEYTEIHLQGTRITE